MSRKKNSLIEALSEDNYNFDDISRRELKEALSDLSNSSRDRNIEQKIFTHIFKILFGLIFLVAILSLIFVFGFKKLNGKYPNLDSITDFNFNKNIKTTNFLPIKSNKMGKIVVYNLPQGRKFYIQVALCKFDKCTQTYIAKLAKIGLPQQTLSFTKTKNIQTQQQSDIYKEIVSTESFTLDKTQNIVEFINIVNERSGYASTIPSENNQFKISLGTFPNLELAEELRRYYEGLVYADNVHFSFSESIVSTSNQVSSSGILRIVAGPFENNAELIQALKKIKTEKTLESSFVLTQ